MPGCQNIAGMGKIPEPMQKAQREGWAFCLNLGGQGRNRTTDTRIFNPLLYQLSYLANEERIIGTILRIGKDFQNLFLVLKNGSGSDRWRLAIQL